MRRPRIIVRSRQEEILVERFTPVRRVEHVFAIVTFVVLVVTGFPQKFDESGFGHFLISAMGGLDVMRLVHRVAGIAFVIHALAHILAIVVGLLTRRMRLTLLPAPQDLKDAWSNLRYYLGYLEHPPALPKFDYRQKFEYIGLVLGGLVMVFSGLVLLFPAAVAHFLPGEVIPAAQVAHSNEAMLALLVLVIWHVYGSHLSPEVFPMDTSIFTGFISKKELKERHALEFARLFPEEAPTAATKVDDGLASPGLPPPVAGDGIPAPAADD